MIGVAVLASSPTMRARLEALVAARPGFKLVAPPGLAADAAVDSTAAGSAESDVLLVEAGPRRAEAAFGALLPGSRRPPVVLLTDESGPAASARLLRAGVRAILPRDATPPEIAAALEAVAAGLVAVHPSILPAAARMPRTQRGGAHAERLSSRELEVLAMTAEGMGNRAIARRLGISPHTVKFHIAAILGKLGARSRTEAVATGMRLGLLMV